jgi:hypothetical protein
LGLAADFFAVFVLDFLFLAIIVYPRLVKDAQNYALSPENKKYWPINSRIFKSAIICYKLKAAHDSILLCPGVRQQTHFGSLYQHRILKSCCNSHPV